MNINKLKIALENITIPKYFNILQNHINTEEFKELNKYIDIFDNKISYDKDYIILGHFNIESGDKTNNLRIRELVLKLSNIISINNPNIIFEEQRLRCGNRCFSGQFIVYNKVGYVNVKLENEFNTKITKFVEDLGYICVPDLHVTLMYDRRNIIDSDIDLSSNITLPYKGKVIGVEIFGNEEKVVVLELESEDLSKRHQELLSKGFQHSYSEYRSHITIIENASEDILSQVRNNLDNLYKKYGVDTILFINEQFEKINEDY